MTEGLYEWVLEENPSTFCGALRPVESVPWLDCVLFCNALGCKKNKTPLYKNGNDARSPVQYNQTATGYGLPSEAQWEFAATAGGEYA